MCIILTCEPFVRPDYELVNTCFNNNPDGAGLMWCEDGRVYTEKGFTDSWSLMEAIEETPQESRVVVHMRIATSGGIDVGTCHPFPVCDDLELLHAPAVECDVAIAHNGIISGVPTDAKNGISDTVYFVSHYVNALYNEEGLTKGALRRIKKAAPHNRFAIMTKDGTVHRLGIGWETVTKGIQASNSTWRYEKLFTYAGGKYGQYVWDWDDDEDDWDDYYDYNEYYQSKYDDNGWGYNYGGGWGARPNEWEEEDEEELYSEEYIKVFDACCGKDCKQRATCMAFGPICRYVADAVDLVEPLKITA